MEIIIIKYPKLNLFSHIKMNLDIHREGRQIIYNSVECFHMVICFDLGDLFVEH